MNYTGVVFNVKNPNRNAQFLCCSSLNKGIVESNSKCRLTLHLLLDSTRSISPVLSEILPVRQSLIQVAEWMGIIRLNCLTVIR